jgi:hypothetical protein
MRAVALLFVLTACDNNETRIYTARAYQVDPGCLESYVPLAVVYADKLRATCEPACFYFGDQLYVSTVCPPYPEAAEVSEPDTDADCAAALAALEQDLSCDAEDVPSEGEEQPDAGPLGPDAGEGPSDSGVPGAPNDSGVPLDAG